MRSSRIFVLLVFLCSCIFVPITAKKDKKSVKATKSKEVVQEDSINETDPTNDATIELNPDYGGEEDDEYDEEYDEEESEDDEEPKEAVNKALAGRKKASSKAMKFVKKHRLKITIAMVLVAFHREIGSYILNKIKPQVYDPVTQTTSRRWMRVEPTQILKIIVFIDVMRQLQSSGKKQEPMMLALLLLGARNPILSSIISKAFLQENSSYVPPVEQHYTFERLNERYKKDCWALQKAAHTKAKENLSLSSLAHLRQDSEPKKYNETVIVLDLNNVNSAPGRIDSLRDEVSFLLHQHREKTIPYGSSEDTPKVELLVLLESQGGSAADFALASQQLLRLRKEPGIQVTVCVDKVAASGGYMIACAASPGRLFAAPFAVLGSIGVIGQTVNVQKTLEGWGVRPIVVKAGKDKAPIGLIGDVKRSDMQSIQTMVDETHTAFKRHVVNGRPSLKDSIDDIATGKVWIGYDALEVGLIDRLVTSDEYIGERMQDGARILKLMKHHRRRSLLGGGHPSRGGFESRIQSSSLAPLLDQARKALSRLVGHLNLPDVEDLEEAVPLVSKVGYRSIETSADASYCTSSSHL